MSFFIRSAEPADASELSEIARLAKSAWGYSEAQMELWRSELEVTASSIIQHPTFVAEVGGSPVGFYQTQSTVDRHELVHLWVHPAWMSQGIGRSLLEHCCHRMALDGVESFVIDADPNAEGFYLRFGAFRTGIAAAPTDDQASRVRPQLRLASKLLGSPR